MKHKSRTEYSMRNSMVALICKILVLLFAYASRVVFIRVLGVECTGAYGLFNNILVIFSLSSLGIDTALAFMLYAPVAENDRIKQQALIQAFRRVHLMLGIIVLLISVVLFFLLPVFSAEAASIPDIGLIYWLFAGNMIFGYFQSHKQILLLADQQNYLNDLYEAGQLILQYVIQIVVLLTTKSFLLFSIVFFVLIIPKNLLSAAHTTKRYPYLKERVSVSLDEDEKKLLRKNIWAILIRKSGVHLQLFTDTLLLSGYFGLLSMARYANYSLIITSVRVLVEKIVNGITGSVGNLGVTTEREKVEDVFNVSLMLTCIMFGIVSIALFVVIGPFIDMSFGQEYVFPIDITLVLCVNLYLKGIRTITNVFRNSLGLFRQARYMGFIEAGVNVVYSIAAITIFGEIGIFIGTTLSMLTVPIWMEPWALYRDYFEKKLWIYFIRLGGYTLAIAVCWAVSYFVCSFIGGPLPVQFILKGVISVVISGALIVLIFHSTKEFKTILSSFKSILKKKSGKNKTKYEDG